MPFTSEYIPPDDVEMLSKVYEELLREFHTRRDTPDAEELAARLVAIYQSGVRDTMLLRKLTLPFMRHE